MHGPTLLAYFRWLVKFISKEWKNFHQFYLDNGINQYLINLGVSKEIANSDIPLIFFVGISFCAFMTFLMIMIILIKSLKSEYSSVSKKPAAKAIQPTAQQKKEIDLIDNKLKELSFPDNYRIHKKLSEKGFPESIIRQKLFSIKNHASWSESTELGGDLLKDSALKSIKNESGEFLFFNYNNTDSESLIKFLEVELVSQISTFIDKEGSSAGIVTGSAREARLISLLSAKNRTGDVQNKHIILLNGVHPDFYYLSSLLNINVKEAENVESLLNAFSNDTFFVVIPCSSRINGEFIDMSLLNKINPNLIHIDMSGDGFYANAAIDYHLAIGIKTAYKISSCASISIDISETGIAPSGISFLLFKDFNLMKSAVYIDSGKMKGEKHQAMCRITNIINPALLISSWFALAREGHKHLKEYAKTIFNACEILKKEIKNHSELKIVGNPCMGFVNLTSSSLNLSKLSEELQNKKINASFDKNLKVLEINLMNNRLANIEEICSTIKNGLKVCKGTKSTSHDSLIALETFIKSSDISKRVIKVGEGDEKQSAS